MDAAATQNFTLQAARFAANAARTAIKTAFAGHFPTIDAVATHDYTRSGGDSPAIGLETTTNSIGVQLNFPIYQGGFVISKTREAMFNYQQLRADMENAYLDATVKTRQSYNNVIAGINQIKADRNSVFSALSTVEATDIALKVGTRTMVDLLRSQSELFRVQNIMSIDQYNYIINTLTLKQQVGTLGTKDIMAINSWIHGQHCGPLVTPYNYHPVAPQAVRPLRLPFASNQTMSLIKDSEIHNYPELPLSSSEAAKILSGSGGTPKTTPTSPSTLPSPSSTPTLPSSSLPTAPGPLPSSGSSIVPPPSTRGIGSNRQLVPSSSLPKTSPNPMNPASPTN